MSFEHLEEFKSDSYKKNNELEDLLSRLNYYLKKVSSEASKINATVKKTRHPAIFIVGVPRSGTTFLTQWLAGTNEFCYPSNLISRFYEAPFFGAMIQELLFNEEYNYKDELQLESHDFSFKSDVGKTEGILEPHEFWYFWRRFFVFPEIPVYTDEFQRNANFPQFIQSIDRFQAVFNKPSVFKSLIINPYIKSFTNALPNALFIHIKRDPTANMQSLLKTRRKYFDDENIWFSFKPKEFVDLKNKNAEEQVAGQVYYLNKTIEDQFRHLSVENKLTVDYDEFCLDPSNTYKILVKKMDKLGYQISTDYLLGNEFVNHSKADKNQYELLNIAWEKVSGN